MSNTILIILTLLILVFALIIFFRRKSAASATVDHSAPPNAPVAIQPEFDQPSVDPDVDQKVLDQLREAGSDLSKPHQMEFLLYFPTEESAQLAASKIKTDGFSVEVKRAARGSMWLCLAVKRMVPKRVEIGAIGKRFTALAKDLGGEYDGWETSIE
jgi:hypothetical protein